MPPRTLLILFSGDQLATCMYWSKGYADKKICGQYTRSYCFY
jgi:hypothetical protein